MIAKSKHARALAHSHLGTAECRIAWCPPFNDPLHRRHAMLLQVRRKRRNQARELAFHDRTRKAERDLVIAQRDLESARTTIRDALPVYVRAQELERRHFGQQFVLPVVFNPQCIWRASLDVNLHRHGADVYELDSQARWVAQDAAEKIHHTITEEIRKQTGAPYGRF
jgi:hypothetical protein